jgi:hypothetical protein
MCGADCKLTSADEQRGTMNGGSYLQHLTHGTFPPSELLVTQHNRLCGVITLLLSASVSRPRATEHD